MLPGIEVFYVAFFVVFSADLQNSFLVEKLMRLAYIDCPEKCVPLLTVTCM